MTSTLRKLDAHRETSLTDAARSAPHGGFKRLALPAVAAAVHTLAQAKPRKPTHHEVAALLRQDGKRN